jgi:carboxymethylenebutenolidase
MGAAWGLTLASEHPEDFHKAVLFYGAGEGDFAKIKAEILGHYSDTDEWEDIDYVRSMEKEMQDAGVKTTFHIYPQMPHWFFEDDRPEFNSQAAELAWTRTLEFLRR